MTRSRRTSPLTREELLGAALRIVDAGGLAALTMRRLADEVGLEAMSLYHHVPSKEALLDLTVDRMRSEMRLDDLSGEWTDVLEAIFVEFWRVLAAHPNMLTLAARRTGTAATSGLDYLIEHGFERDDAVELYQSLVAFAVGFATLGAGAGGDWPGLPADLVERLRDFRSVTFRRTLRSIMAGYATRIGAAG